MNQYDESLIKQIVEYIFNVEKEIAASSGKDLIVFIGPTQIGKSTTINSLLGVNFKHSKGQLEAYPPSSLIAPIGSILEGGISCTTVPTLYISNKNNLCFLDTRGFFDTKIDAIGNIKSTILLQMAISQAKSVSLVNLCQYSSFERLSNFQQIGEQLGNFIVKYEIPMYFLFNRFPITEDLVEEGFFNWSEEEKNSYILKQLNNSYKLICDGGFSELKKDLDTAEKVKGGSLKDDDPDAKKMWNKAKYLSLIHHNFTRRNYGYIDPTSQESVQRLSKALSNLQKVDVSDLSFHELNQDRIHFDQIFENSIKNDVELLFEYQLTLKYPDHVMNKHINELNDEIKFVNGILLNFVKYELKRIDKIHPYPVDKRENLNDAKNSFTEKLSQLTQAKDLLIKIKSRFQEAKDKKPKNNDRITLHYNAVQKLYRDNERKLHLKAFVKIYDDCLHNTSADESISWEELVSTINQIYQFD